MGNKYALEQAVIISTATHLHNRMLFINNGEPMDGDAVDILITMLKEELNILNGNVEVPNE